MADHTATITAKTGPAKQLTAVVFHNVKAFRVDIDRPVLFLEFDQALVASKYKEFDLTGVTTFTVSISSGTYTITVS